MSLPESNGQTLLITGINGYIASVLGHLLLTKGYNIRGTARKAASTQPLLDGAYKAFKERVEIFEVPDMTVDGAFDEPVKGVDGIFHVASPVSVSNTSFEGVVGTAVAGNRTLLNSALDKAGPQLKAVVVTSSIVASYTPPLAPGAVVDELQFNQTSLEQAIKDKEAGVETPGLAMYVASKTAAERLLWEFKNTKAPKWAISTINPTVVVGPTVYLPQSPSKLNETLLPIWKIFSGNNEDLLPLGHLNFVDVRDVAASHLWCYENHKAANGERYILAAGFGPHQAAKDILREAYPDRRDIISVGEPGKGYVGYGEGRVDFLPESVRHDGRKAAKVMGLKYIDFKTSLLDTTKVFEQYL